MDKCFDLDQEVKNKVLARCQMRSFLTTDHTTILPLIFGPAYLSKLCKPRLN